MVRTCLVVALSALAACYYLRGTNVPIPVESHAELGPERARGLIVLLPGLGDAPAAFVEHHIVADLRARGDFDLVAPDAHLAYYRAGILPERIMHDVITPARARGYREIWLVGISLGGFGALDVARVAGDQISGAVLLAPYLGNQELLDEVSASGGIAQWTPGDVEAIEDEEERAYRRVFRWLHDHYRSSQARPALYVGYGRSDRFAEANRMLAALLPASHSYTIEGDHSWTTWRKLLRVLAPRAFAPPPAASVAADGP